MENLKEIQKIAEKLLNLIGLNEPSIGIDEEGCRLTIFVNEGDWFVKQWLPRFLGDFERIINLSAKRYGIDPVFIDINNYRKKREELIVELARAAARKVLVTKTSVELPAMNAYERRLIHTELAGRPDVATESAGERKDRHVVVQPTDF